MKCLVAYYSWTGHTAAVAKALAQSLHADLDEIRETKRRSGVWGYFRAGMEGARKDAAPIQPTDKKLSDYDLVVIGTPVWAGNMASPVRGYIERERHNIKQLALFCTLGGRGGAETLESMAARCGREPIARLAVTDAELKTNAWRDAAAQFVAALDVKTAKPALVAG